jgi:Phytanoyl-CoA dioxygenase (PhyH)
MVFRLRRRGSGAALAEPAAELAARKSTDELLAEIEELTRSNRERREPEAEVRLATLRHAAGIRLLESNGAGAEFPEPAFERLPGRNGELPGIKPEQLTPDVLRAGILRDGCVLVRGVLSREDAAHLVDQINAAFGARADLRAGRPADAGYYREFPLEPRFAGEEGGREWTAAGGGLWVADSPHLIFEMLECFERAGLTRVITDYLGERPLISVQKCTLRKVNPDAGHGWHQDGAFLGDVRALNVWLALSRCGDESPGMDIVPKRLDHIVPTGTEGAFFKWSVSPQVAEEAAGETGVLRPVFEPGDVLLFDELFLHSTAADPSMKKSRMAIESWFFGASAAPGHYAPLAV